MTALPAVGTGHEPAPRVRVSEEPSEYLVQLDVSKVHAGRADGRGDWVRASGLPSRRLLPNPLRRHSSPRSPRARRRSGVGGWRRSVEHGRGSAGGRRPEDRARPPPLEAGRSSPARSAPIAMAAYIAATAATTANESANSRRTEVGSRGCRRPASADTCVEASAKAVTVPTALAELVRRLARLNGAEGERRAHSAKDKAPDREACEAPLVEQNRRRQRHQPVARARASFSVPAAVSGIALVRLRRSTDPPHGR